MRRRKRRTIDLDAVPTPVVGQVYRNGMVDVRKVVELIVYRDALERVISVRYVRPHCDVKGQHYGRTMRLSTWKRWAHDASLETT